MGVPRGNACLTVVRFSACFGDLMHLRMFAVFSDRTTCGVSVNWYHLLATQCFVFPHPARCSVCHVCVLCVGSGNSVD